MRAQTTLVRPREGWDTRPPALPPSQDTQELPIPPMEWQAIGVERLGIFAVSLFIFALILKASGDWWIVSIVVGVVSVVLLLVTSRFVWLGIVQVRRDNHTARIRELEVRADYITRRAKIDADREIKQLEIEHQGAQREAHMRHFELTAAGQEATSEPIEDPLKALAIQLLLDAYDPANVEQDGRLVSGPTRKRIMDAGHSRGQAEDIQQRLIGAGVLRFERGNWYVNRDRFPDAKTAYRAVFGEEW